ncbi:hypothetical protein D3C81_1707150 [compost metagenome]
MRNFFRLFILVDQTSDQFHQPWVLDLAQGAHAKLFDQHHFIAPGIVWQHADRIMTHEQLAADFLAHAAGEQLMAQMHSIKTIKTLETVLAPGNLDIGGYSIVNIGHEIPRCPTWQLRLILTCTWHQSSPPLRKPPGRDDRRTAMESIVFSLVANRCRRRQSKHEYFSSYPQGSSCRY